jgi:hypothetical protein
MAKFSRIRLICDTCYGEIVYEDEQPPWLIFDVKVPFSETTRERMGVACELCEEGCAFPKQP